jgi:hypothetical protein
VRPRQGRVSETEDVSHRGVCACRGGCDFLPQQCVRVCGRAIGQVRGPVVPGAPLLQALQSARRCLHAQLQARRSCSRARRPRATSWLHAQLTAQSVHVALQARLHVRAGLGSEPEKLQRAEADRAAVPVRCGARGYRLDARREARCAERGYSCSIRARILDTRADTRARYAPRACCSRVGAGSRATATPSTRPQKTRGTPTAPPKKYMGRCPPGRAQVLVHRPTCEARVLARGDLRSELRSSLPSCAK